MPIVHVYLWEGRDEATIKQIIKNITKAFEDVGIPPQAVDVIIHEIPKSRWGIAGELASEKSKNKI